MAKKATTSNPFIGRWRIVSMDQWDREYIDEEEEGFVEFRDQASGGFHFGYVYGEMDCDFIKRGDEPAAEWTWEVNDESETVFDRGWAVIVEGELHGMVFFHEGERPGFTAKRKDVSKGKRK